MSRPFLDVSLKVSSDFLQTVAFVDDEASYTETDSDHILNAQEVTRIFASKNKASSIYKVSKSGDLDPVVLLSKRCDVTVIDWRIVFAKDAPKETEKQDEKNADKESDDEGDIRGKFALDIISKIVTEIQGRLKLIIIYTGESDLQGIADSIYKALSESEANLERDTFNIWKGNLRISVLGKGALKGRRLTEEAKARLFSYDELPDAIVREFAFLSSGLITNVVLKSLSVIRENTFRVLSVFDKSVDAAFLAHKALLPHPDDALEQILDVIGSDLKSLLKSYDATNLISNESIENYIEERINETVPFEIENREKFATVQIPDSLTRANLKTIVKASALNFFIRKTDPREEHSLFENHCFKTLTNCFASTPENAKISNMQFAVLTSVKTNYNSLHLAPLTQGTIVQQDNNDATYWLCIQPKCDSVRIDTKKRAFLHLLLKPATPEGRFDIVLPSNIYLKIDYATYRSKFFDFTRADNGMVMPVIDREVPRYTLSGTNFKMIWIGELKSDFAQSIANQFSSDLARVGMDHSEWLRRS